MDGIVGIRSWDDKTLRVYRRSGGRVDAVAVPFQPWLAVADPAALEGDPIVASITPLPGSDALRSLVRFDRWPLAWQAIQKSISVESERRRQRVPSYLELSGLLFLSDPAEQWLADAGVSFFRGTTPSDLLRLQLAIETDAPPGRSSRSDRSHDRILTIAATISDGRKSTFRLRKQDEATLLNEFVTWFAGIDPDVVEGIELTTHTLPYLAERCALHGIEPALGREGTMLRPSATPIGKGPWELPGRIVLEPAEALRHAGPTIQALVLESRTERSRSSGAAGSTPARRCQEARRWADLWWDTMLPVMTDVPLPPDRFMRSGPGHWLEAWLVRECLRQQRSLPSSTHVPSAPQESPPTGLSGWFGPAAELALIPSKAAAWRQLPEHAARTMPDWIQLVRDRWESQLDDPTAGARSRAAVALLTGLTDAVRARSSRLHVPGVSEGLDRAIAVTAADVAATLRRQNVDVIQEVGERLYVQIPDNVVDEERRRLFWARVNESLPKGLRAVPLRSFDAIISLAPRTMHGASAGGVVPLPRPHPVRSPEPFIREYHINAIALILRRQWNRLHQLTAETIRRIKGRAWHVSDFCRRETLTGSLEEYQREREAHRRNPSAPYEALLRAQGPPVPAAAPGSATATPRRAGHDAGSTVVYYIAGTRRDAAMAEMSRLAELWDPAAPDENTEHYLDRLRQSLERYRPLLSEGDFSRVFGEEDLFSFADEEIAVLRRPFASTSEGGSASGEGFGIWLDVGEGLT